MILNDKLDVIIKETRMKSGWLCVSSNKTPWIGHLEFLLLSGLQQTSSKWFILQVDKYLYTTQNLLGFEFIYVCKGKMVAAGKTVRVSYER